MRRLKPIAILSLLMALAITAVALAADSNPGDVRKQAIRNRNNAFVRARNLYPDPGPELKNFPMRKALVDFTLRQDLIHHPWYVYILGDNGNVIGYYVAKTVPENACNFLSSTEDIYGQGDSDNPVVATAPSYDGVYYGQAACDSWFFFDQSTNALIQIRGVKFYAADQPLRLEAKPILVKSK